MPDRSRIKPGLRIDHALFTGHDLDAMESAFERIGIEAEYGGEHANGVTHNSLVGFDDGTYLELITTVESDEEFDLLEGFIRGNGGPAGWAVEPDDIAVEADRLADAGIDVDDIEADSRETPDETPVQWEVVHVGGKMSAKKLPFLITDVTPRERRTRPTESVTGSELTGIGSVVIAVEDLDTSVDLYQRAFEVGDPEFAEDETIGIRMAHFPGTAVILAAPIDDGWLGDRLQRFGEGPCAFLLASSDVDRSLSRRPLKDETKWFGRRVAWFEMPEFDGKIGVISRP